MKLYSWRRHTQMGKDGDSSHKTTILLIFKISKDYKIASLYQKFLLNPFDLADWWSCIGKNLCLQPVQQACLKKNHFKIKWEHNFMMMPIFTLTTYLARWRPEERTSTVGGRDCNFKSQSIFSFLKKDIKFLLY